MYERSAIVLERFFSDLLGFNKVNNLKKNFDNYCELFEKFKVVQKANSEEFASLKDFQDAENEIEEIQNHEEKLYKKIAKLQYNRDLIFQDISQNPDEIEKCSLKIEGDIQKNHDKLVTIREEFVEAVRDYNDKKVILEKCKKTRKKAEVDYNEIFEETQRNIDNISQEYIKIAKDFADSEIQSNIIKVLSENGKDEKIPFNNQVITNAAQIGFDIKSREVECYLEAYKLSKKLVRELLDGAVSMELHEKTIRNLSVKLNFLNAEKEYIVGFLDYERITVIYGKRMHRTLMIDACEKLEKDIEQVGNLYQILLKEIAEKSTKKAYRDLYNKSYLIEMEDKDAKFKKEKNRVNISTGTVMNSNYWRIEGIKNIYTVFYRNVVEVFGKDLDEFELPKEIDDSVEDEKENSENYEISSEVQEISTSKTDVVQEKVVSKIDIAKNTPIQEREINLNKEEKIRKKDIKLIEEEVEEENNIESIEEDNSEFVQLSSKIDTVFDEIDDLDNKPIESEKLNTNISPKNVKKIVKDSQIEEKNTELVEDALEDNENISYKKKLKLAKIVKKRGRKKLKHYTRKITQIKENIETFEPIEEENIFEQEVSDDFDIFGDKYKNIDSQLAELEDLEEYKVAKANAKLEDEIFDDIEEESIFDIMEEDEDELFNFSEISLEDDIIDKKSKKKSKSKNGIFSSFKKLNSKSKKKLANE